MYKRNNKGELLFVISYWMYANGDKCEASHTLYAKDAPAAISKVKPEIEEFLREYRYCSVYEIYAVEPVKKGA